MDSSRWQRASDPASDEAPSSIEELLEVLELEVLDLDLYRAHNPAHVAGRRNLFGGQVAGQALRAATLTVDADRHPHSLHGYFLRPGRSDRPTVLHVARDRDGTSVSARRVTAVQEGQVIFSLAASFHAPEVGPELDPGLPPDTPSPEEAGPPIHVSRHPGLFEIRPVRESQAGQGRPEAYWARAETRLPDDPRVHACVLTYLSDMGVGEGRLARDLVDHSEPSIDHAVWFHRPVRLDEWVLFSMHPLSAQAGRLLYTGTLHDRSGRLVATMIQECLVRPPRPAARG